MNTLFDSLFAWLLDFGCLASVLLTAAILLRWLLRQPASRVTLAWGTWLAIVAGGAVLAVPDRPRIDFSGWLASPVQAGSIVFIEKFAAPESVAFGPQSLQPIGLPQSLVIPSADVPTVSPADVGVRAWLVVALLGCGWLLIGMARAWRLIARSQVAPQWTKEELERIAGRRRRMPSVLTNEQLASALALGTIHPRIVLPLASTTKLNAPAVRAALAHEWAHIAAGDLWLLALERSLLPLLALHPLFWWLRRLTRLDQELAADNAAAGDKPAEYAEALLAWAKVEAPRHSGVAALAMWERPSNLSRRIQMILDPKRQTSAARRGWPAYAALSLLLALAVGASLVAWRPMSAQDPPQPKPTILLTDSISDKPLPAPAPMPPAIRLELKLLTLNLRAIADAKVDFPITPDRPADVSKGGLITVQLGEKEASRLVEVVLGIKGAEMLSQPQIVTLDGQEATLQVGGELPIAQVEEIIGSERRERRVEFKSFGTKLRVLPRIVPDDRRNVLVEIAGEKTSVNPAWKADDASNHSPLLSTHKIELAATVELGKTLVLLSPAKRDTTADPAAKTPPESLLILLRPSVVEHKYVEVDPNLVPRARNPAAIPNASAGLNAGDEAKLAEQLRAIRESIEALAREREASRHENTALKAELERLKAQLKALPQLTPGKTPSPYRDPQQVADGGTVALGGIKVKRAETPSPTTQVTQVYKFANAKQPADVVNGLNEAGEVERLRVLLRLEGDQLTITGSEAALIELRPKLTAAGSLILEAWQGTDGAHVVADQAASAEAVRHGLEWLEKGKNPLTLDPHRDGDRDAALAAKRATERRLLELDLQEAEIGLEAAQKDFNYAKQLHERKALSDTELDTKRFMLERAKIQVARIKVQLEATQEPPGKVNR